MGLSLFVVGDGDGYVGERKVVRFSGRGENFSE